MENVSVYKIGGNIIDDKDSLDGFLEWFSRSEGRRILVHGGGKIATRLAGSLGLKVTMVEGRRVTDRDMLDIVVMTYAGLINKNIVASLAACGCNAIGLCGADGALVQSRMRAKEPYDYGYVGDPVKVNTGRLGTLLESGFVPVVAPITMDTDGGGLLNTNADTVAQTLATALAADYEVDLYYRFEKRGVLLDVDNPDSLVENIDRAMFEKLRSSGQVSDGMVPKLQNALAAVESGVRRVHIGQTVVQ